MPEQEYCECGCGQQPKPGKRYIHNHHWRGKTRPFRPQPPEVNAKRSATQLVYPKDAPCAFDGCELPRSQREWCSKHYSRWYRNGDPAIVHPRGWFGLAEQHPSWQGDDITYRTAHTRLRAVRGKPETCEHCGGQAAQWAFDHERCTRQLESPTGLLYSPNVDDYLSLCRKCHVKFDIQTKGATP